MSESVESPDNAGFHWGRASWALRPSFAQDVGRGSGAPFGEGSQKKDIQQANKPFRRGAESSLNQFFFL